MSKSSPRAVSFNPEPKLAWRSAETSASGGKLSMSSAGGLRAAADARTADDPDPVALRGHEEGLNATAKHNNDIGGEEETASCATIGTCISRDCHGVEPPRKKDSPDWSQGNVLTSSEVENVPLPL
ncbi:unnamed protein product, partial [Discosporangium mesarthrocarpum]